MIIHNKIHYVIYTIQRCSWVSHTRLRWRILKQLLMAEIPYFCKTLHLRCFIGLDYSSIIYRSLSLLIGFPQIQANFRFNVLLKLFLLKPASLTGQLTTLEQERLEDFLNSMDLIDGPSSNLAEVVHTGWINSHTINLHKGIKCSLHIKQWMKDLGSGGCIFWV